MNTKEFTLDIKAVDEAGVIEGWASTFGGAPDAYGDVVVPGAFADSLVRHKREGTAPLMLFGHRASEVPIGGWDDLAEDGKGLWVKGTIDLDDPLGGRVHRALKNKRMRGLSIGYATKREQRDEKNPAINRLLEVDLFEISIVTFPANRRATVTAVKAESELRNRLAAGDRLTVREWERLLKEHFALSNSEAERAVRLHLRGGSGDPGADDGIAFLRALTGITN